MRIRWFVVLMMSVMALPSLARGQQTERGATIGGIGGALAGAAIGKNNGDTAAGALIGGAVGLITGAAIGNSADERDRRAAYQNQQMYLYSRAVSSVDVVSMSQNGVGEDVIINHIRENGVQRRPDVGEVISLHRQGVSERVISAMQNAPEGGRAPAPPPQPVYRAAPAPVVVEEHYYVRPSYWHYPPPYYRHHYHHHHHPHSHVHWGFSFGR
jgi:surface antigen